MKLFVITFLLALGTMITADAQKCTTQTRHMEKMANDANYAKQYEATQARIKVIAEKYAKELKSDGTSCATKKFIPVAVHYDNTGLTAAQMTCLINLAQDQINVLNAAYGGQTCQTSPNSFDSSSGGCFEFKIATRNHPAGSGIAEGMPAVTFGGTYTCANDADGYAPCFIAAWSGYMNFVVKAPDANGTLGVAPLGGDPDSPAPGNSNTVIMNSCAWGTTSTSCAKDINQFVGNMSCVSNFPVNTGGATATHEAGHFLGLAHTFCRDASGTPNNETSTGSLADGTGCQNGAVCSGGCTTTACDCDNVTDTPPQAYSQYGCPGGSANGTATNPSNPGVPYTYNNFMDYVDDACMTCFTAGQAIRANATYDANPGYKTKAQVCDVMAPPMCELTSISATAPVCSMDNLSYTVTVSWVGADASVTITAGGAGAPASVTTAANNGSQVFTYPNTDAAYAITVSDTEMLCGIVAGAATGLSGSAPSCGGACTITAFALDSDPNFFNPECADRQPAYTVFVAWTGGPSNGAMITAAGATSITGGNPSIDGDDIAYVTFPSSVASYSISLTGGNCSFPAVTGAAPNCMLSLSLADPCDCGDPLNVYDGNNGGVLVLYHDIMTIKSGAPNEEIVLNDNDAMIQDAGVIGGAPLVAGAVLGNTGTTPDADGMYTLTMDFWHPNNGMLFSVRNENQIRDVTPMCTEVCPMVRIPTLGEWGIIVLSLLFLIFGVTAVRQRNIIAVKA